MSLPPFVGDCLSKIWNKQFPDFSVFSGTLVGVLDFPNTERNLRGRLSVPLELRNVPSNVVITTDLPENLHILLRDKGSQLLAYRYTRQFKPVVVDYNTYSNPSGHVSILGNELQRQIAAQLLPGTQMLGLKPDTLDFTTTSANSNGCLSGPLGEVRAGRLYSLAKTVYSEDSVTVYASREQLDTITAAYLQPFNLRNPTDTTHVKSNFVKVKGAKFVPAQIGVTFCIDRLVEKNHTSAGAAGKLPGIKTVAHFPGYRKGDVSVGMGLYRKITSENFVLVVNYEDLLKNKSTYCHLSLKTIPQGVSHVRISPQDVEYVIEEIPDYEQQPEND